MSKKVVLSLLNLVLCILIFNVLSCAPNSTDDSASKSDDKLSKIDISNAVSLLIAPISNNTNNLSKKSSTATNKLFKVTENGELQELKYLNATNEEISTSLNPIAIFNVNANYLIVGFGSAESNIVEGYLVKKSDGAVFSLDQAGFPYKKYERTDLIICNKKFIYTDKNGDIYYSSITEDGNSIEVIKLDVQNYNSAKYSPITDHIEDFIVDKEGNLAYVGRLKTDQNGTINICRIKKSSGGLFNIPDMKDSKRFFWISESLHQFYYLAENNNPTLSDFEAIKEVTIDTSDNVRISDYATTDIPTDAFFKDRIFIVELQNRAYFVIKSTSDLIRIVEVNNPSKQPQSISSIELKDVLIVQNSNRYFYLSGPNSNGNPVLLKVNPIDGSYITLINGEYDIFKMDVSSSDEITFNALRMADGSIVIGGIDSNNKIIIINEIMNSEAIALERIN